MDINEAFMVNSISWLSTLMALSSRWSVCRFVHEYMPDERFRSKGSYTATIA